MSKQDEELREEIAVELYRIDAHDTNNDSLLHIGWHDFTDIQKEIYGTRADQIITKAKPIIDTEWIKALLKEGIMVANPEQLNSIRKRLEEEANKQERERIISAKYAPLADFVIAMVTRLEDAEATYGDWRDINDDSIREHLEDEIIEWQRNWQSTHEMIDVVNCLFMLWCIYANPPSWQALKKGDEGDKGEQ